MKSTYISLSEVAQELALTRRDVRQLVKDGLLTCYRFGKHLQFKPEDVSVFVEGSRIDSGSGYRVSSHSARAEVS